MNKIKPLIISQKDQLLDFFFHFRIYMYMFVYWSNYMKLPIFNFFLSYKDNNFMCLNLIVVIILSISKASA